MKQFMGIWLPDHEVHLQGWMSKTNRVVEGKGTYQLHKLEAALSHVKQFRRAIDVGAHCGLWSMHLVKKFERIEAFEPVEAHRQCFKKNVAMARVNLWLVALGESDGSVSMHTAPSSSGDTYVNGAGDIGLRRMDDCLPEAQDVDFIKLDCEGYELFALRGGEELIKRCKPVICVEQKPRRAEKYGLAQTQAVDYLQSLGATLYQEISGDYILGWN